MPAHSTSAPLTDTQAIFIDHPYEAVFSFLSDPMNLPRWAVGFCQAIREDPAQSSRWLVRTGQGEVGLRLSANEVLGTIDFTIEPAPGVTAHAYSRLMPAEKGTEYSFTQVRPVGMPEDEFAGQVQALTEELTVLRSIFAARQACRA